MYILQRYMCLTHGTGAFQLKKMPCEGTENLESLMKGDSPVLHSLAEGQHCPEIRGLSKKPACRIAGFYIMALVNILQDPVEMFGEGNFVSNGQSLSGDEGEALSEKPPKACRKRHVGKAAFLPPVADQHATPELELIQCLNPGGLVLQEVTGVQRARLPFPAGCLILQNSFYSSFAQFYLWKAESTGGGGGQASWRCRGQGKGC